MACYRQSYCLARWQVGPKCSVGGTFSQRSDGETGRPKHNEKAGIGKHATERVGLLVVTCGSIYLILQTSSNHSAISTLRPGDWHDTRSDSGPKRSAPPATTPAKPKSPAPPKGPPPGRTATPPKHPPQQKGLPPPKPKGPTGPTPPRHAPAPKKGSAPPRTAPASQSSRTAPASQSSASTPQKGAGPPKGSSKGSSLPKSGPSKAPTKTVAKEGSMNRRGLLALLLGSLQEKPVKADQERRLIVGLILKEYRNTCYHML